MQLAEGAATTGAGADVAVGGAASGVGVATWVPAAAGVEVGKEESVANGVSNPGRA